MAFNVRKSFKKNNISTIILFCPIVVYIDSRQYTKYINSKTNFHLLFELSVKNRKYLLKIVQDCLKYTYFRGIIFTIDKNEILFDRLFFLKSIALKLFNNNKDIGIWGVPDCVIRFTMGNYYFSQIVSKMIPENSNFYSKYIPTNQHKSSLLLECNQCIASYECDGLGSRMENRSMWGCRISNEYRKTGREELFKTDNEDMQKTYNSFCEHIDNSDQTYADRYLYFVKNIDFGSSYSFSDRFVYHCDYLPLHDYEKELGFLDNNVQNKSFLLTIKELSSQIEISKIAYTKAGKSDVSRESFYLAQNNMYNDYLLNYFNLELALDLKLLNKIQGIGIDFYNGQIKSYKIYFLVPSEILLKMYPQYFEKIDINILDLHEKQHHYIIRLDANRKRISERIDLTYNEKDYSLYESYFKYFPITNKDLKELYLIAFDFEFEAMNIKKINIYYRNRFYEY